MSTNDDTGEARPETYPLSTLISQVISTIKHIKSNTAKPTRSISRFFVLIEKQLLTDANRAGYEEARSQVLMFLFKCISD